MRVLVLHNRYQVSGGEDTAVRREIESLAGAGITVDLLEVDNDGIKGAVSEIQTALLLPYSPPARRMVAERIRSFQPDVVHVHNFFPRLTPSVYDAAFRAGLPVVQTLHNFRLVCANALLFRDGKVCTECLGRAFPLPAIRHACYRGSHAGSAAVALMIGVHRQRETWSRRVSRFIALTHFARLIFAAETGIPDDRIAVKPNSAPDPGLGDGAGGYALYAGRFSTEKGIETLLAASALDGGLGLPLKVAGSGPLQPKIEAAHRAGRLEFVGLQDSESIRRLMHGARVLLVPSICFEGLPMVVPEAFGAGLPVVASRIGALETLIDHGANGLLVEPGNPRALTGAVRRLAADQEFYAALRRRARRAYDSLYRPETNAELLLSIYQEAQAAPRPGA